MRSTYVETHKTAPVGADGYLQDLRDYLNGSQFTRRLPLTELKSLFPEVVFDEDIPQDDILWDATGGTETHEAFAARIKGVFDSVWTRSKGANCESYTPA